ncbi:MAG: UBA/THIF-type binding protein [Segetibacter sp.]|nr:UBA/THIF-type binding protein [Segetibacter sp.]
MLLPLINHSPDLKRLWDEGYELEIKEAYLLLHHIPYVNKEKQIKYGILVSTLTLAGDGTHRPDSHVTYFIGETPCRKTGNPINEIIISNQEQKLGTLFSINYTFSSKPASGYYNDYYEKMTTYIAILSTPAKSIDDMVTEKTFRVIESEDQESVFVYQDSNSSRAKINPVTSKLKGLKVAIIGLGGTGSYILDLICKTPLGGIHLFDGDYFLQHNAFRAPGAASKDQLRGRFKKSEYYKQQYSNIHKNIYSHPYFLTLDNLEEVSGMDFVFLSMEGDGKIAIIEYLILKKIPFIDVGIGILNVDDSLSGQLRVTASTKTKNDHIKKRIPSKEGKNDYSSNIQIAELNALNAAMAVVKWKKIFGFYHDFGREGNSIYVIDTGKLISDDLDS